MDNREFAMLTTRADRKTGLGGGFAMGAPF
jgi:hypothetical protein